MHKRNVLKRILKHYIKVDVILTMHSR